MKGLLLTSLLICTSARVTTAIYWLGLTVNGSSVGWNETQHCRLLHAMVPDQQQLCRRNLELMRSVVRAAEFSKTACRHAFGDMRWNCSSVERAPHFLPDLAKGTREAAFVSSLSAAVLSHTISRACSSGELPSCSCAAAPAEQASPDFRWGGCGDNVRFGLQMGAAFSDAALNSRRSASPSVRLMHLHNNAVGRQVLLDSVETKCKCHGVSGSCSVKTCWKSLLDVGQVSAQLKARYLSATKVTSRQVGTRRHLVPRDMEVRPVLESELVYLISSPDYCTSNIKHGSYGTTDRQCNKTASGSGSCNLMCCGRGYNTYTEQVEERCHCRYHWCCYVTCKKCTHTVERHVCK
ncbi:protein Wnt-11 isoform X1 [Ictalurus punctatus]|uniref:Protein Wnt n=2 Tax=Ictalurus punctatus TaxID=7998 RepID=A0A2D0Q8K6_ICTPU|nr:protein Wnt-11 isoform X1 [Ictalurus punctatus]XP_053535400.1 protein Wnt-11 isoform X1 [Ictalurus punctatus]